MIADMMASSRRVRSWPADDNPEKRKRLADVVAAREAMLFSLFDIPVARPTFDMDTSEVKAVMDAVRRARNARKVA